MKLDLLYELQAPKPWSKPHPYGQREAEQKTYFDAIEQIKLADKVGFNCVWVVEHHFRMERSHSPSNESFLAALSQITDNIRLGFGVTLTPHAFNHPVRNAERVATVDLLSRGRVEWGTGRSIPHEQLAFGVDKDTSRASWEDAIRSIVSMWEQERFTWDSEFLTFPAISKFEGDARAITPKPYQDPHPPCWMAAVSPESVELAGRSGLGMLSLTIFRPVSELAERIKIYRDAIANCTDPLTRVITNKVAPYTLVHCAPSMAEAEAYDIWGSVAWWYTHTVDFILEWEFPPGATEEDIDKAFPGLRESRSGNFDPKIFSEQDMVIIGDPDQCLEKFERYAAIGCDQVICYMQFGHLEQEQIMASIDLLGTKVIPKLAKARKTFA